MSRSPSEHGDRGDGVCVVCLVELPCEGEEGLDDWIQEEKLADRLAESVRRVEMAKEIREILTRYGFEEEATHVVDFSMTVTLNTDRLRDILRAIEESQVTWE